MVTIAGTTYRFTTDTVNSAAPYEAFDVADGLVYAQFHDTDRPTEAVSLFLDLHTGRTLSVLSAIGDPTPGRTRVRQEFTPGWIEGMPVTGPAPAPTTALIGRRAAVTVADHRDLRDMRSHGVLFGLDETGQTPTHFTFGAFGRLLSNTIHPAELDPARRSATAS